MKKVTKKLTLSRETLKSLEEKQLSQIAGGAVTEITCFSCLGQPCPYK